MILFIENISKPICYSLLGENGKRVAMGNNFRFFFEFRHYGILAQDTFQILILETNGTAGNMVQSVSYDFGYNFSWVYDRSCRAKNGSTFNFTNKYSVLPSNLLYGSIPSAPAVKFHTYY